MKKSNSPQIVDVASSVPVESRKQCDTETGITLGQLPDDALLTRRQTSVAMNTTMRFLEECARKGNGPPMVRLATRTVRYRVGDLRQWLASRVVNHTQQEVAANA